MKATLEFDLPQDDFALKAAEQGLDLRCAVRHFDNFLRSEIKYRDPAPERAQAFDEIRTQLWEVLGDYGIELDD